MITPTYTRLLNRSKTTRHAHTHVGDARATNMTAKGKINIGQLAREEFGEDNVGIIGFLGYKGEVIAGLYWGDPLEIMPVPVAIEGSWEDDFNDTDDIRTRGYIFNEDEVYQEVKGNRAIGVVYHTSYVRGNYVPTELSS